jgi:hypothetical protein
MVLIAAARAAALRGCQSVAGKTASQSIDDATITASVRSRWRLSGIGTGHQVDVDTNQGVVFGSV